MTVRSPGMSATPAFSSIRLNTRAVTANTTATSNDSTIRGNATAGAITVALPAAASVLGLLLIVKKTDASANVVTVDPAGSETVDGALTVGLSSQYQSVEIQSNGTSWDVLSMS